MYCRGTVGKMFLIAVANAETMLSTSWLQAESSPVRNVYVFSLKVMLSWLPRLLSSAWTSR